MIILDRVHKCYNDLGFFALVFVINYPSGLTSGPLGAGEVLDSSRKEGVLRTPLADIWPPSVLHNASVELDGFDVEVMKKFSKRKGLKVDYIVNADKSTMGWQEQTSGEWKGKPFKVLGRALYRTSRAIAIQPGDGLCATLIKKKIDSLRRSCKGRWN